MTTHNTPRQQPLGTTADKDWPAQKKPPQRHAEAHDDTLLESVGKAVSAPIEGAAEDEPRLDDHQPTPPARPRRP